ncbi:unnamed protein product, partial [Brenthis ino]
MALNEQTDMKIEDHPHIAEGSEESQIQKTFSGSTIFLTGGTGFLGKLLIEKFLRSCPNIKKLYLLTRAKKNKNAMERLQEQFEDLLYDKLRKENPDFMQKIGIIEGDMGQINLGMSDADRGKIIQEVEFIFHSAATVRLDEAFKTAVEINVRGTRDMLQLARACTKLRALVYISTAYSNCPLKEIDEKFYDSNLSGEKLIDLVENIDENTLKKVTLGLNIYLITVISTVREPVPGWIDNVYGPTGVVLGACLGLLHSLRCNPQTIAELVPGDYVINGIIAVAWKTAKDYPGDYEHSPVDNSPTVYNYVSSEQNPITWGTFKNYMEVNMYQTVFMQVMWMHAFWMTPSKFLYNIYSLLLHWIPAYIVDTIAVVIMKKPVLRKAYKKAGKLSEVISFFAIREWKFHNKNTLNLLKELDDADKHIFNFDIGSLKWDEYFKDYLKGIRLYLLKDPLETIPQAKKKYFKLVLAHYFLVSLIVFGLLKLIWCLMKLFM